MSQNVPEPLDPSFRIELPSFEGPLDLLLHLCQKHELAILDLPVAFVTERYLEYIRLMERLDLDIASEYLVMAATLAHIKSKMLLPSEPEDQQDEGDAGEEIDPRAELIRRLLEYQKYKAAAEELGARGVTGRDTFMRGTDAPEAVGPAPLAQVGLFKLLDAFQAVLKRAKAELAFEITAEGVSIQDRMTQLTERLRGRARVTFDELFEDAKSVYDVVVTFLAILEMAKRRLTRIYQAEPTATIHLERLVVDEHETEPTTEDHAVEDGGRDTLPPGAPLGDEGAEGEDLAPGADEEDGGRDTEPPPGPHTEPAPPPDTDHDRLPIDAPESERETVIDAPSDDAPRALDPEPAPEQDAPPDADEP